MKWSLILTLTFALIFLTSFTSAWSNDSLYNGTVYLINGNMTFVGNSNVSLNLSVPSSVTHLTSAYMNLSGYYFANTTIQQPYKTWDVSQNGVTTERGMSFRVNNYNLSLVNVGKTSDETATIAILYDASHNQLTNASFVGNYAKLNYSLVTKTVYIIEYSNPGGTYNSRRQAGSVTLPINTSDNLIEWRRFYEGPTDTGAEGAEIANMTVIAGSGSGVDLYIGSNLINELISPNSTVNSSVPISLRTSNLNNYINTYLSTCSVVDSYCQVPLVFHSNSGGILPYYDMLFTDLGFTENTQNYNSSTYETAQERFNINITYDSSLGIPTATLYYNNIGYSGTLIGTGNTIMFSSPVIDIPTVSAQMNKSFYWNITIDGVTYQSIVKNQTVIPIVFGQCNTTNNMYYINETFLDETYLNATFGYISQSTFNYYLGGGSVYKTLTYQNSTQAYNYSFCFSPINRIVYANVTFQYGGIGYGQRSYTKSYTLTNSTTVETNYLLLSSQGISSAIQTVQSIGNPVSGVLITAERQISGSWITVGSALSDSSGLVTFFVNPNYDMRVTASKTGYTTQQVTIRPSQTQYSIVMNPSSGTNVTYTSDVDGITWRIFPATGQVGLGAIDIGINITSTKSNLLGCKLDILQQTTNTILTTASASGTTSACDLSTSYTVPAGTRVYVQYYVKTTGSGDFFLIDGDQMLYNFGFNNTNTPTFISNLFKDLNNLPEFGNEPLRQEFSKIIAFFFIAILLIGLLCYFTEYDRMYPGFFFILLTILIMVATKAQFLTVSSPGLTPWLQQYAVAIIAILFNLGYVFNTWGKVA